MDKEGAEIAWVENGGGGGKKDGERWLFAQIVVLAGLSKIHTHTLLIHLKETPRCFYFLGENSIKINSEIPKAWMW